MSPFDKPITWLGGEITTPPFSVAARREAGFLLRELQKGAHIGMPRSRPMPVIGARCHELRINAREAAWRIVYRIDLVAVVVVEVFDKRTEQTPPQVIALCRNRLRKYDIDKARKEE